MNQSLDNAAPRLTLRHRLANTALKLSLGMTLSVTGSVMGVGAMLGAMLVDANQPAQAQLADGWYGGATGGLSFLGELTGEVTVGGVTSTYQAPIKPGLAFNLFVGKRLSDTFSLEGMLVGNSFGYKHIEYTEGGVKTKVTENLSSEFALSSGVAVRVNLGSNVHTRLGLVVGNTGLSTYASGGYTYNLSPALAIQGSLDGQYFLGGKNQEIESGLSTKVSGGYNASVQVGPVIRF